MCTIKFTQEKTTKNTVRFTEVLEGQLTNPAIGTIYIPKETLKAMGWNEGDDIEVNISNAGKPATKARKTAAEKAATASAKKTSKAGKTAATKAATASAKKTSKKK